MIRSSTLRALLVAGGAVVAGAGASAFQALANDDSSAGGARAAAGNAVAAEPAEPVQAAETKVRLFNGKDLAGWVQYLPDKDADPAKTWQVKEGVIHCTGQPAGYLRTEKTFKNYFLVLEWRWDGKPDNSGVLLHMQRDDHVWPYSIEAQLQSGSAGDFWFIGGSSCKIDEARRNPGSKTNIKHMTMAEKPAGEWNRYEITCLDGNVVLVVNGELVNVGREATPSEGHICLQSEGAPIEFREITLTPIP